MSNVQAAPERNELRVMIDYVRSYDELVATTNYRGYALFLCYKRFGAILKRPDVQRRVYSCSQGETLVQVMMAWLMLTSECQVNLISTFIWDCIRVESVDFPSVSNKI